MSIAKLQKNPLYRHSHPGLAVRHMCGLTLCGALGLTATAGPPSPPLPVGPTTLFPRVLRDCIGHFLVGPLVRLSVTKLFENLFIALLRSLKRGEETFGSKQLFKKFFSKKIVYLSICQTFFEDANTRNLGLMTLFFSNIEYILF